MERLSIFRQIDFSPCMLAFTPTPAPGSHYALDLFMSLEINARYYMLLFGNILAMGLSSSVAKPICLVWHPLTLSWPLPEMLGAPCGQYFDLVHRPLLVVGVYLGE